MNAEEVGKEANTDPWSWTAFLTISNLFHEMCADYRKFGLCNLRNAKYPLERLDICLESVSLVIDLFNDTTQ